MMGRLDRDQGQFLYCFDLEEVVPEDHLVRAIAAVLDLSWVYGELAPYYSRFGRPSLDPALMIRMLIVGYVFGHLPRFAFDVSVGHADLTAAFFVLPNLCHRGRTSILNCG
jgi:hypothetical protein